MIATAAAIIGSGLIIGSSAILPMILMGMSDKRTDRRLAEHSQII